MMHASSPQSGGSSSNSSVLRSVFVQRVHQLIQLGYEQLTPANYAKRQEPAITGDLVEAIDNILSNCQQQWMAFFSVHDDPPVNDGRRKGKQRKRVDLRIDSGQFRPRARYRFEAKRLGKRYPVTVYLGLEGLGCFLRGDYASEDDEAGMLGYAQSGDLEDWGQKISEALAKNPTTYAVTRGGGFSAHTLPSKQTLKTYCSQHDRASLKRSILIMHILLKVH